jgi:hypothetical protein
MNAPKLTKKQIALAFSVAVIADAIQLPFTASSMTGILTIPVEGADFALDCAVMVVTSSLLGFHWILLPSLIFEFIPGFDLCPTWTAAVAYVIWRRKKEQSAPPTVDVVEVLPPLISNAPAAEQASRPPKLLAHVPHPEK